MACTSRGGARMYLWVTGRRGCGKGTLSSRWLVRRAVSSLSFVWVGRGGHPFFRRQSRVTDKRSGLMAAWPPCAHTFHSHGIPLGGSEGRTGGTLLVPRGGFNHLSLHVPRTLSEPRQAEIRKECLRLWGVSVSPAHCLSRAGQPSRRMGLPPNPVP